MKKVGTTNQLPTSEQTRVDALKTVNGMNLPKVIAVTDDSFSGLGPKTIRYASKELERLEDVHGENLPFLLGIALREIWYSLVKGANFFSLMMASGEIDDNEYTRFRATPDGCGAIEGMAWTLCNNLGDLVESPDQATFREGTPFHTRLSIVDILRGAALHWFASAAAAHRAGDTEGAFDFLQEAHEALSSVEGHDSWSAGEENAEPEVRTALAKMGAKARHAETENMKAATFKWLDENMTKYKSLDAAAEGFTSLKLEPIKFRTARKWAGEWKKQRSAGSA